MENAIWLSSVVVLIVILAMTITDRQSKLNRRIDAIDRKLRLHPEFRNLENALPEWQRLALDPSSKIAAIQAYRQATGASLAEAKAAVEKWMKEG